MLIELKEENKMKQRYPWAVLNLVICCSFASRGVKVSL